MSKEPSPMVSVRLDPAAARALRVLEATGRSRSDSVRHALVRAAAEVEERAALAAEAAALAADPVDAAEVAEVRAMMEELRAPW